MITSRIKQHALAMALAGITLVATSAAAQSAPDDAWTFAVTPYLWLPNINGTLKFNVPNFGTTADVEAGPNDWLEKLDFALLISGEARKGKWSVFTDVIYLDFSSESSHVKTVGGNLLNATLDLGTQVELSGGVWTLVGGYTAIQEPAATLDVIGGFRYLNLDASANWSLSAPVGLLPTAGGVSQGIDLWDAIVGVRGQVKLGDGQWSLPYYADVGTGSSNLTWQAIVGVAYRWNWGDISLAYRHLTYDMGDDKLLQDVEFSGPALGATFRF